MSHFQIHFDNLTNVEYHPYNLPSDSPYGSKITNIDKWHNSQKNSNVSKQLK